MLIPILSFTHDLTTLLFGIFISAFFLGVKQNSKNILTLFLFFCCEGALYITSFLVLGGVVTNKLYAIIIHLPLIIFLTIHYEYPPVSCCLSVFSAYLCCQLSNWFGLLVLAITDTQWCYYSSRIIITCITFFLICRFVCHTTEIIFARNERELYIIGLMPSVYYIFDYAFTKLSGLLYSGNRLIVEFMGFVFCIAYFTFLFLYFREHEKQQEIKQYNALMEMKLLSIQNDIEQVKKNKRILAILKHDMRHHLNIIMTHLQNNNTSQAADYIREIGDAYDDVVITAYCRNEMIDSVISIYQTRLADKKITLNCDIIVGETLPCTDIAICTILSNALENSMYALEKMNINKKWVNLTISNKKNRLLISVENPVLQAPKFADGIPTSGRRGHGIGVKSIVHYVEQLNGQCHFSVSDDSFILRIMI